MQYRYKYLRFPEGKAKAVTLSYDDGCREDLRFSDAITRAGLKCTFNLNCNALRENNFSDETIREYFLDRGHEIAVHGAFHRANGTLRPIEGIREVLDCRLELEQRFGRIVRGMAYPDSGIVRFSNGACYDDIKSYLSQLDIAYCRTLGGDNKSFMLPQDWHAWMPSVHHNNPDVMDYVKAFLNIDLSEKVYISDRFPRLFYMWGHSYEFERNGNWNLLDVICSELGGREDIWYATNMEIYEYVSAYNSLVYSADGNVIYNPTLFDIWFDIDGTLYEIKSGQTLKL